MAEDSQPSPEPTPRPPACHTPGWVTLINQVIDVVVSFLLVAFTILSFGQGSTGRVFAGIYALFLAGLLQFRYPFLDKVFPFLANDRSRSIIYQIAGAMVMGCSTNNFDPTRGATLGLGITILVLGIDLLVIDIFLRRWKYRHPCPEDLDHAERGQYVDAQINVLKERVARLESKFGLKEWTGASQAEGEDEPLLVRYNGE